VVRVDGCQDGVLVHGVVAPDRREALIAFVTTAMPAHAPGPPMRFPGLDPRVRYRVRPLVVAAPPSGLRAPAWWGEDEQPTSGAAGEAAAYAHPRAVRRGARYPGTVVRGDVLATIGLAAPLVHPDEVVLFHAAAVETPAFGHES
jgi:alpha-galactosidase